MGCLLRGIEREEIERGQVLAKAGSVKPHTKFMARVYVLTKEEGGRHTPFYNGYRPQFYLRTTDVTGAIGLTGGAEMIMPGDNVDMDVELITPDRPRDRPALRHPRGRPHRRRRRDHRDQGVARMAKAAENRPVIQLACTECKERSYSTTKNKKNDPNRIELQQVLPTVPEAYPPP